MSDQMVDETQRDITAARSELTGRRDQLIAEADDRLAALESLSGELGDGKIEPRAAQAQIRKILGDKGNKAASRAAGRTTIGMNMPTHHKPQPMSATGSRSGVSNSRPTAARAQAAVGKQLAEVDRRMITLLSGSRDKQARIEARFELSLLMQLRRSLETHLETMPSDVILLGSVVEYAEHAQGALADLEAGGASRVKRLLEFDRSLASELLALGGTVKGIKDQIKAAQKLLAEIPDQASGLDKAFAQALAAFGQLQTALEKRFPVRDPSMLDDVITTS